MRGVSDHLDWRKQPARGPLCTVNSVCCRHTGASTGHVPTSSLAGRECATGRAKPKWSIAEPADARGPRPLPLQGQCRGLYASPDARCLLANRLGIEVRRVGTGTRLTFASGEASLSEWMARNASICWATHPPAVGARAAAHSRRVVAAESGPERQSCVPRHPEPAASRGESAGSDACGAARLRSSFATSAQQVHVRGGQLRALVPWYHDPAPTFNISRRTARGSIDSPSAINLICPAEVMLVVHKGEWKLGRTEVSDVGHDEWLRGRWQPGRFQASTPSVPAIPPRFPRSYRAGSSSCCREFRRPGHRSVRWQRRDRRCCTLSRPTLLGLRSQPERGTAGSGAFEGSGKLRHALLITRSRVQAAPPPPTS
jgi:hypothetical protein